MKRLLTVLLLLTAAAFAQGVRIGDGTPVASTLNLSGVGNILTPSSTAAIAICTYPANAVPCTNKATTYTTQALSVACATSVQVTLPGTSSCVANADSLGNWGAWVADGTYDYTITVSGHSYGPYTVSSALPGWSTGAVLKNPTADQAITGFLFTVPDLITKTTPVYDVRGYASVQAAITAAGAAGGGTVFIPSSSTIASALTASSANVTLQCAPNVVLQAGTGIGNMLAITGGGVTVDGCTFDNNSQGTSGAVVTATSVTGLVFRNNKIKNVPNGIPGFLGTSLSNSRIMNNVLTNIQGDGIKVVGTGTDLIISENTVDGTNQPILAPHGGGTIIGITASTGDYTNVAVNNNTLTTATDFCIAIGASGSNKYNGNSVNNNVCRVVNTTGTNACETAPAARACGGISVNGNGTTNGLSIVGNNIYMTSQRVTIGGIELVQCAGCSVTGNTVYGSGSSSSTDQCVSVNGTNSSTVSGNVCVGWGTQAAGAAGMFINPRLGGNTDGSNNTISGNTFIYPSGGTSIRGVNADCGGVTNATVLNNTITGNTFLGQASNYGVVISNSGCTPSGTQVSAYVGANSFKGVTVAVNAGLVAGSSTVATVGSNLYDSAISVKVQAQNSATVNQAALTATVNSFTTSQNFTSSSTDTVLFNTMLPNFVLQNTSSTNNNYNLLQVNAADGTLAGGWAAQVTDQTNHYMQHCFAVRGVSGFKSCTFKISNVGIGLFADGLQVGASGSSITDSRELVQNAHSCGTTTTCANTANGSNRIVFGTVALTSATPSTAVVTNITAFTSTSSYNCTLTNMTNAANNLLKVVNTSTTSFTITGPNTITDTISYICIGS